MGITNQQPILHLPMKRKWFEMIASGEKREEYREDKDYWDRRFISDRREFHAGVIIIKKKGYNADEVLLCFHDGYGKDHRRMYIKCNGLRIGPPNMAWTDCHDPNEWVWILELDKNIRIETKQDMY